MPQKDLLGPAKIVSSTLTYDQKALYKFLGKWFQDRQYNVLEKDYKERVNADGKRVYQFKWVADKKVDDYTAFFITLDFKAEVENVPTETHDGRKKTAQNGEVTITFQAYIERDYEDEWALTKERPTQRLLREIYDKLVIKGRFIQQEGELRKDLKGLMNDAKTYLKTHRYD